MRLIGKFSTAIWTSHYTSPSFIVFDLLSFTLGRIMAACSTSLKPNYNCVASLTIILITNSDKATPIQIQAHNLALSDADCAPA